MTKTAKSNPGGSSKVQAGAARKAAASQAPKIKPASRQARQPNADRVSPRLAANHNQTLERARG